MVYALVITIAAGVLLLFLIGGAVLFARRAATGNWPSIGRWRWYPSPLGLLLLLPLAGLLLWRIFPALLLLPVIFPFFLRGRRWGQPLFFLWNLGRRNGRPADEARDETRDERGDDSTIEGQYRPLDEE